jgi:hypothetical protein
LAHHYNGGSYPSSPVPPGNGHLQSSQPPPTPTGPLAPGRSSTQSGYVHNRLD